MSLRKVRAAQCQENGFSTSALTSTVKTAYQETTIAATKTQAYENESR